MAGPKPQDKDKDTGLQDDADDIVKDIIDSGGFSGTSSQTIELPEGYKAPPRQAFTGVKTVSTGAQPIIGVYQGDGLVDENGQIARKQYADSEIKLEWFSLPYAVRKKYIDQFKEIKLISKRQVLDPNLTGDVELSAFSAVLANANIEGRTWRGVLPLMASRSKAQGLSEGGKPKYRPTSIADINQIIQQQATSILGRGLTSQEAEPLAQRFQQQETRQQTRTSGEQPTRTSTLIEEGVQKKFAPEAQAFNFARFAQSALGYAGSSAGARPDVELETMGEM